MSTPNSPEEISPFTPTDLHLPKLIIGEGVEEVLVFEAVLSHLELTDVGVEHYGGKQKLAAYLDVLKLRPGFAQLASLGVTRDADESAIGAFASVQSLLQKRQFVIPNTPGDITEGSPRVGIIILPDGVNNGALEDLCLAAWREDPLLQCIDAYFDCVSTAKGEPPRQISKARVHAWLAAQGTPDMRLGIAAKKGLIDWNNPAFERLVTFIKAL